MQLRRNFICAAALATALFATSITNVNAAAPKVGSTCKKAGIFFDTPNARYSCNKEGKKLVWRIWNPGASQAELLMAQGKQALDVLDSNLHDIVKGLPYDQFMLVRDFHKAGSIDKGKSDDSAQKIWERQVNRMKSTFEFVTPKSQAKDAERKAAKRAEDIAKLATVSDGELLDLRDAHLRKGDSKSIAQAQKLAKELERRNASDLDAEKAQRKMTVDKIITRVKELSKAGTDDADELLFQVLAILG